jgi:hypothetical protein
VADAQFDNIRSGVRFPELLEKGWAATAEVSDRDSWLFVQLSVHPPRPLRLGGGVSASKYVHL